MFVQRPRGKRLGRWPLPSVTIGASSWEPSLVVAPAPSNQAPWPSSAHQAQALADT